MSRDHDRGDYWPDPRPKRAANEDDIRDINQKIDLLDYRFRKFSEQIEVPNLELSTVDITIRLNRVAEGFKIVTAILLLILLVLIIVAYKVIFQ